MRSTLDGGFTEKGENCIPVFINHVNKSYSRETSLVTPYSQTSESYGAKNIYVENEVVSRVVRRS